MKMPTFHWYGCTHGSTANLLTRKRYSTEREARREFRQTLKRPLPRHATVWPAFCADPNTDENQRRISGKMVHRATETCKHCKHRGEVYLPPIMPGSSWWRVCPACNFPLAQREYFRLLSDRKARRTGGKRL